MRSSRTEALRRISGRVLDVAFPSLSEDCEELAEDKAHGRNLLVDYLPLNRSVRRPPAVDWRGGELQILSRATEHAARDNFSLSDVFHNESHGPFTHRRSP